MLGGARHAGVERVEIHLQRVGNVARHHRPLEEMDVVQPVDDAGGVVDVLQQALSVFALLDVDQMHRRARRAVVHALALDHHVVPGVLAAQREVARGPFDRVEHEVAWKTDAAVRPKRRADPCQRLDAGGNGVGETDRLQQRQHRLVDAFEVVPAQRSVAPAFEPGAHWPYVIGQRRSPHGAARLTSARAAGALLLGRNALRFNDNRHVRHSTIAAKPVTGRLVQRRSASFPDT